MMVFVTELAKACSLFYHYYLFFFLLLLLFFDKLMRPRDPFFIRPSSDAELFMYLIRYIWFGSWKVRRLNWAQVAVKSTFVLVILSLVQQLELPRSVPASKFLDGILHLINFNFKKVKYARISLCRNWVIVKLKKEKKTSSFITYKCIVNDVVTFKLEIGGITPYRRFNAMRKILFHRYCGNYESY